MNAKRTATRWTPPPALEEVPGRAVVPAFPRRPVPITVPFPSERPEVLRKRALKEARQKPDLGADGPAALTRPVEVTEVVYPPGPGSKGARKAVARRYTVECHLDALNMRGQLPDRLWRAGMMFRGYWLRARKPTAVTAAYGDVRGGSSQMQDLEKREHCRDRITEVMEVLGPHSYEWHALASVAGEDEACAGRLRDLQSACRILAAHWKVPADYCRTAR